MTADRRSPPRAGLGPWRQRALRAPIRGAALLLMGIGEAALFALTVIAAHVSYLLGVQQAHAVVVLRGRGLPNLARRLAGRWSGVPIAVPYQPAPPAPAPGPDGLYRDGDRLFRTARWPARRRTARWLLGDDATWRDLAWLIVDPVIGGALAALPVAMVGYGIYGIARAVGGPVPYTFAGLEVGSTGAALPAAALGVVLALAGFCAGPAVLGLHARWTRVLLAPRRTAVAGRATQVALRHGIALRRLITLPVPAAAEVLMFAVTALTIVPFHALALWPWWPEVVRPVRGLANLSRRNARIWSDVAIAEPYAPPPPPPQPRPDGFYRDGDRLYPTPDRPHRTRLWRRLMTDPTTWRELLWLAVDPVIVAVLALPVSAVTVYAVFGLVWPWVWWPVARPFIAYDPALGWTFLAGRVPADRLTEVPLLGLPVGVAALVGCAALAPVLLMVHARWSAVLLTPSRTAALTERVRHLTETRTVAAETYAAELRRVERDLHDGTQARLLAIALKVATLDHLIDSDPGAAKVAATEAQDAATTAMRELRALIEGIHPPMLAERGLGDAVRALALGNPLAVRVVVDLPESLEQPVETAAYFAVSELLANATRHSGAAAVSITLAHDDDVLAITVEDDGLGGAAPGFGSGLDGIRRRLAPFDGTLSLRSPAGGPTLATIALPCPAESGAGPTLD